MKIVTLLTDFGLKDGNVGVMKGVVWGIAPEAQISDLTHLVGPQNVREAALILSRSAPYFPDGTVHIIVVDPGVGTERRPIAARIGRHFYVAPDNGVITPVLESAEKQGETVEIVHLDRPEYWLPQVSHVFHGRDIFAPAGGHLAAGVSLFSLGNSIQDPVRIKIPQPVPTGSGWRGEIIHIDHFGNVSTNLKEEQTEGSLSLVVRVAGQEIGGLVRTFGERQPGELIALYGSTGSLILSVVNGSAAERLKIKVGEPVEVLKR